jgi:hypothetical protein
LVFSGFFGCATGTAAFFHLERSDMSEATIRAKNEGIA